MIVVFKGVNDVKIESLHMHYLKMAFTFVYQTPIQISKFRQTKRDKTTIYVC